MQRDNIHLTGVERHFADDEIIVSKTDPKGRITYANDIFLKIAGYRERDVLGQPHSIIRHPHMPRCVYAVMWETIARGEEIFAYVVNRCANGDHYWVLANVTPTFDSNGAIRAFHSNRRRPRREAVAAVSALYTRLRAEEETEQNRRDGMARGLEMFKSVMAQQGMNYDEFVHTL
ncbi:PAS domain-containing protein [Thalassospira sp.]|uniref:PAS domain-containing protein n=1 Tax=Thalassospira sp. TaxID=1912094 RepID=UPI0027327387|nr:PAS domain-containing protein [Thalassospira sp.]MDP2697443.1 PAS domain-containing protein [Thalassospira sp.]